ncbi:site-specific integrase [Chloroflexi bacterium TSY]|nr:site-specific integrase [Chloroflexi bacterium TSY]
MSRFFDYLADEAEDESWSNPVVWRLHRLDTGCHLPRDIAERIVRQLWGSVSQGQIRDQVMLALMLDVGLRVGEVSKPEMGDIEAAINPDELWSLRVRGKGNKERRVWLTPETTALLVSYMDERPDAVDSHLFLTRRHKGISVRGIQERLDYYRQQAGLSENEVSCHRLRHTFARRMAESRMPLPSLSHWLGHSQLKTTQIYIDGANPDMRADYEAAMEQLSRQAACSDIEGTTSAIETENTVPSEHRTVEPAVGICLSADEIRQRLTSLPLWLHQPIISLLLHQQLRWKALYRRERALQWLGELQRGWQWMLDQRMLSSLSELRRRDLQDYITHLCDLEYSVHTINHFICTLKCFLHFAEECGQSIAPALYRIQRLKRPTTLPRPLRQHEFAQLEQFVLNSTAQSLSPSDLLDRAWFLILVDAGLRMGEVQALLVRDAKSHRDRRLPVTQRTALAIDAHLQHRTDDLATHSPLLLRDGLPLRANYVRNHLHAFAAQANLEGVTPHRLRHTFATRLLNSGLMPITTLQKLMGHTHIDTTMLYAQLYDETIQQHYLAAMASHSVYAIPEPDPAIWGPTLENAFESTFQQQPL